MTPLETVTSLHARGLASSADLALERAILALCDASKAAIKEGAPRLYSRPIELVSHLRSAPVREALEAQISRNCPR